MPVRVLVAKPGLDGHDRGAKVVSQLLRDAGMEVIYSGLHTRVEDIVRTAVQEDVDVIGLSILSGAHLSICKRLFEKLGEKRPRVVVGGVVPKGDVESLRKLGVDAIFTADTSFEEIVETVQQLGGKDERRKGA
jgi:methylmalonyl-CoA mutase C-terminal domain/subunit